MIQPDGKLYLFGRKSAVKKLRQKSVRVVVPENVPLIIIVAAAGETKTYGPKGGSMQPYDMIAWAIDNAPAFGVSIELLHGKNMPVLWLPSEAFAKRMVASLNKAAGGTS